MYFSRTCLVVFEADASMLWGNDLLDDCLDESATYLSKIVCPRKKFKIKITFIVFVIPVIRYKKTVSALIIANKF